MTKEKGHMQFLNKWGWGLMSVMGVVAILNWMISSTGIPGTDPGKT